ncbi:MAG: hypothetical protein R3A11_09325 [Bdellovibrionota bacterium]
MKKMVWGIIVLTLGMVVTTGESFGGDLDQTIQAGSAVDKTLTTADDGLSLTGPLLKELSNDYTLRSQGKNDCFAELMFEVKEYNDRDGIVGYRGNYPCVSLEDRTYQGDDDRRLNRSAISIHVVLVKIDDPSVTLSLKIKQAIWYDDNFVRNTTVDGKGGFISLTEKTWYDLIFNHWWQVEAPVVSDS